MRGSEAGVVKEVALDAGKALVVETVVALAQLLELFVWVAQVVELVLRMAQLVEGWE